jgi:hypothetical protein
MDTVLYLVAQADKCTPYNEFFESITIMNEERLRRFAHKQISLGNISQENLRDHDCLDTDVYDMELETVFALLSDNDQYDEQHGYYISQQEVSINAEDMYN